MATLEELANIERDANDDPDTEPAAALLAKVRIAGYQAAQKFLTDQQVNGYPDDPEETNNAIGWAQAMLADPGTQSLIVFRAALAGAGGLSPPAILNLADLAIVNAVNSVIPRVARGAHPGRR